MLKLNQRPTSLVRSYCNTTTTSLLLLFFFSSFAFFFRLLLFLLLIISIYYYYLFFFSLSPPPNLFCYVQPRGDIHHTHTVKFLSHGYSCCWLRTTHQNLRGCLWQGQRKYWGSRGKSPALPVLVEGLDGNIQ